MKGAGDRQKCGWVAATVAIVPTVIPLLAGPAAVTSAIRIIQTTAPSFPISLGPDGTRVGEVRFVIGVDALAQWRFTPPTRHGQPVCVRAVQHFRFNEDS